MSAEKKIFNFFNQKIFFRPIWHVNFCKTFFICWYCYMVTIFKFMIFFIISFILKTTYFLGFKLTALFWLCYDMYCCIFNYIMKSIDIHIFWYWSNIFIDFVSESSNKSFSNNRFSFIIYWKHLYIAAL